MKITLENITKIYQSRGRKTTAADQIDLDIASGEFFFLLGPSGCGKTTLLRMLAGLMAPSDGRILFHGKDVTHLPVDKRNAAMVFQGYALWPHMTVLENVAFGPRMQKMPKTKREQLAREHLEMVQLEAFEKRKPNELSGGQQQRVALARALAAQSDCLLLDEPLSNLDARLRLHMRDELRQLVKKSGVTAVYVTHDQKEALSMADRIAVMDKGKIIQVGAPETVYTWPETRFVADFLGEANFIDGQVTEAGAPASIQTAYGMLLSDRHHGLQKGMRVTCCIRPEQVAVIPSINYQLTDKTAIFDATITRATFLGEMGQFTCRLHGQNPMDWKVTVMADVMKDYEEGQTVNLQIPADKVAIVK